jgi:hypothetical protein
MMSRDMFAYIFAAGFTLILAVVVLFVLLLLLSSVLVIIAGIIWLVKFLLTGL